MAEAAEEQVVQAGTTTEDHSKKGPLTSSKSSKDNSSKDWSFLKPTKSYKAMVITNGAEIKANRAKALRRGDTDLSFKQQLQELDSLVSPRRQRSAGVVRPSSARGPRVDRSQHSDKENVREGGPEKKVTTPEPFHLASMDRHLVYSQRQRAKSSQAEEESVKARNFRARPIAWQQGEGQGGSPPSRGPAAPKTPPPKQPATKAKAPKMLSEQRGEQRRALEERYKARDEEAARVRAQEEEQRLQREVAEAEELRKAHRFSARKMPDFSTVWTPGKSTTGPTKVQEFRFNTDQRLGKPVPRPEQRPAHSTILSPAGTFDAYSQSLREGGTPAKATAAT